MAKTVVLIDDDQDDLDVLREAINAVDSATHCISFINPTEAMRVICEELVMTPDYLFIDINMPGMTGDECVAEIRKRKEFNNSVIAVLSTSVPNSVSEALKKLGANFTFEKPTSVDYYNNIIQTVFSNEGTRLKAMGNIVR